MGLLQQNNDSSAIYKHRFRDGIKDPAEIDALREEHVQQAKQNQLLAQQVADNKRRKEEAEMKRKAEEMAEGKDYEEREELKKQYEDEIASQKAKKEAQQKAMLTNKYKNESKKKMARREREKIRRK